MEHITLILQISNIIHTTSYNFKQNNLTQTHTNILCQSKKGLLQKELTKRKLPEFGLSSNFYVILENFR